eukprot:GILK01000975.1.p1 GENE.GILK01000975.1~~GILK01000975.1.p1  ORF type:complete len:244 (-),score=31.93 GILK01000975.1:213-905(-)
MKKKSVCNTEGMSSEERHAHYQHIAEESVVQLKSMNAESESLWSPLADKDGIKTWSKHVPGESLNMFRGRCVIRASAENVIHFIAMSNIHTSKPYDPMYEGGRVVEKIHDHLFALYQSYKAVWPTTGRDFCNLAYVVQDGSVSYCSAISVDHPDCPPVKGKVRAFIKMGGFVITRIDEQSCDVSFFGQLDLCGSIPAVITNMVCKKQPMCLADIRRLTEAGEAPPSGPVA